MFESNTAFMQTLWQLAPAPVQPQGADIPGVNSAVMSFNARRASVRKVTLKSDVRSAHPAR